MWGNGRGTLVVSGCWTDGSTNEGAPNGTPSVGRCSAPLAAGVERLHQKRKRRRGRREVIEASLHSEGPRVRRGLAPLHGGAEGLDEHREHRDREAEAE